MSEHTPVPHALRRLRLVERIASDIDSMMAEPNQLPTYDQERLRAAVNAALPETDGCVQELLEQFAKEEELLNPQPVSAEELQKRRERLKRRVAVRKAAPQMLEALEAALRIESLWIPPLKPWDCEHPEEAEALHLMRDNFIAAIKAGKGE